MDHSGKIVFVRASNDPQSQDSKNLWEWRNDPTTRMYSLQSNPVGWEDHTTWYAKTVSSTNKTLLIANYQDQATAMIRIDASTPRHGEISINLNPAKRGMKLGCPILVEACRYAFTVLGYSQIDAQVKTENLRSIKVFEGAGFLLLKVENGICHYQLLAGRFEK